MKSQLAIVTLLVSSVPSLLVAQSEPPASLESAGRFVENRGQWTNTPRFRLRGENATAWFVDSGFVLDLAGRNLPRAEPDPRAAHRAGARGHRGDTRIEEGVEHHGVVVKMTFEGSATRKVRGVGQQPGYYNFMVGVDRSSWRTEVPAFAGLRYPDLYSGIALDVRSGSGLFVYDLRLAPGADPTAIRIRCEGVDGLRIDERGRLILRTGLGELMQSRPVAWQVRDGVKSPVECGFRQIGESSFGFTVGEYAADLPLVIDPDVTWLTYFGGSASELLFDVERNTKSANGLITTAGRTSSKNFPTTPGVYKSSSVRSNDVVISRFDLSKTGAAQLVWSTFFGGTNSDTAFSMNLNVLGDIAVAGYTFSSDFPTSTGAFQTKFGGVLDGFVASLNGTGTKLLYSTYLGGENHDWACAVAYDSGFRYVVTGYTRSAKSTSTPGFPTTTTALQGANAGLQDAFVTRLDPAKNGSAQLTYSLYFGGRFDEGFPYSSNASVFDLRMMGMELDKNDRVLFCGRTQSTDFPRKNPAQAAIAGNGDAYVTIVDTGKPKAAQLVYSTYFGTQEWESAMDVDWGPGSLVVFSGFSYDTSYPTTVGAFDRTFNGTAGIDNDQVVTWLDTSKALSAQIFYSTYLGGTAWESADVIDVDERGVAEVCGFAGAAFPTTTTAFSRTIQGTDDGSFSRIAPRGKGNSDLVYSTYIGGTPTTALTSLAGLARDGVGGSIVVGYTTATGVKTTRGAWGPTQRGSGNALLTRLWGLQEGVQAIGSSMPVTCAGGLRLGARGLPNQGNTNFVVSAWGAQANSTGFLGIGVAQVNLPLCGGVLYTNPLIIVPVPSDAVGGANVAAPIGAAIPLGTKVLVQWVVANTGCCITTANAIEIIVK